MVKIVDKTKERKMEDKLYRSMLEKAVDMFGDKNVTGLDSLRITVYDKDQGIIGIDVISSQIHLYDNRYLARAKKLAMSYESMTEREFTIELEYH